MTDRMYTAERREKAKLAADYMLLATGCQNEERKWAMLRHRLIRRAYGIAKRKVENVEAVAWLAVYQVALTHESRPGDMSLCGFLWQYATQQVRRVIGDEYGECTADKDGLGLSYDSPVNYIGFGPNPAIDNEKDERDKSSFSTTEQEVGLRAAFDISIKTPAKFALLVLWVSGYTLRELADVYGCSHQNIYQKIQESLHMIRYRLSGDFDFETYLLCGFLETINERNRT